MQPDAYTKDQVAKTFRQLNARALRWHRSAVSRLLLSAPVTTGEVAGALMCLLAVTILQRRERREPLAPPALLNGQQIEH